MNQQHFMVTVYFVLMFAVAAYISHVIYSLGGLQ